MKRITIILIKGQTARLAADRVHILDGALHVCHPNGNVHGFPLVNVARWCVEAVDDDNDHNRGVR